MKKKLVLFLIVFITIIGISLNVNATDEIKCINQEFYFEETNPLYKQYSTRSSNLISKKAKSKNSTQDEITPNDHIEYYIENIDTLAGKIRDNAVIRKNSFIIYSKITTTENMSDEFFTNYVLNLRNKALSQSLSVSSSDGDYLKWSWMNFAVPSSKYWVNESNGFYTYYFNLNILFSYYTTYEQEQTVNNEVESFIRLYIDSSDSRFEKICKIYDYITANITYDYENLYDDSYKLKHTAYAAIHNKTAVCQGYATLLYKMLKEVGINEVRVITSSDHAWNAIKIGSWYYDVDSTWDAPTNAKNLNDWNFFLRGTNYFNTLSSHTMEDCFNEAEFLANYPLSSSDYNFTTETYFTRTFQIDINNCQINNIQSIYSYIAQEIKPLIVLKYNDYYLVEGIDYIVTYKDNINPGIATIRIDGLEFFDGYIIKNFQIKHSITDDGFHKWNSGVITKLPTYDEEGIRTYTCTICGKIRTEKIPKLPKTSISKASISGIKAKVYNGKAQTQSITLKLGNVTLKKGIDYNVIYKDNKKVGKATITITGIGAYNGTISKTFVINPKGTTISKLTKGKKQFKTTWKKNTTETTGYQIQYSTSSKFSGAKTVTINKNKTTATTIKKLKGNKKYYVRIRTYKIVNGSKYYSSWSGSKNVTTKK